MCTGSSVDSVVCGGMSDGISTRKCEDNEDEAFRQSACDGNEDQRRQKVIDYTPINRTKEYEEFECNWNGF